MTLIVDKVTYFRSADCRLIVEQEEKPGPLFSMNTPPRPPKGQMIRL